MSEKASKNYVATALAVMLLAPVWQAAAEGDVDAGRAKFETCKGCHAIDGYKNTYPTFRVPKLAGQNAEYIIIALKAYRDGQRKHGTMQSNAVPMSDQDIADIAAYIGSFNKEEPAQ